ncbi:hypothetical protein CDAR_277781 [Caerostris darwini]|uniref:DNA-directed RNA polymerase n=1 Tax=Caerostris darwini TaxID=1538125 RepID=A0AAV4V7Y0_9ARAC|nr:hypothetical protein CDAR_277781 [Caerostris darwini]
MTQTPSNTLLPLHKDLLNQGTGHYTTQLPNGFPLGGVSDPPPSCISGIQRVERQRGRNRKGRSFLGLHLQMKCRSDQKITRGGGNRFLNVVPPNKLGRQIMRMNVGQPSLELADPSSKECGILLEHIQLEKA